MTNSVSFVDQLAGGRRVLELAIGTGRIALSGRGVEVNGIDISAAMVAQLRRKPAGERIPVTIGDFTYVAVAASYGLVHLVFNTLFKLLTPDDQVRCFENVAAHLGDDGSFVVEAFVPS